MIGVSGKPANVDRVLVIVELPFGTDIITLGDFSLLNGKGPTVFSFTTPPRGDVYSVKKI
jgi:hypothetical protein